MSEFSISDIADMREKKKTNYKGRYIPEHFWNEYGKFYIDTFKKEEEVTLNTQPLIARLHAIQPKSTLEIGCGFGRLIPFITENIPSADRVVGVELSKTMIENSNRYLTEYRKFLKEKIEIVQGDAKDLPFEDNSFDLVYSHVCLTHIPPKDIPQVTREISRVAQNWILHIERFNYPYEHPNQHRWSHLLAPFYLDLGWEVHECDVVNKEHFTNVLVLRKV